MTSGALPHPKFHPFELAVNDSFECAMREQTRAKYVVAVFGNVDSFVGARRSPRYAS
jgi:hypothetical protein